MLHMKRVAVTGSSGFIGKYALPYLSKLGYKIYPLRLNLSRPEMHRVQLNEIRPDALLHFAWEATPQLFWHASSNLNWLTCSLDLIENFILCGGKRVVIAGTCAENFPSTLYGACKESLRLSATAFLRKQNVSFAWGRIFFPYGPYEKEGRLIPSLIKTLLSRGTFTCSSQNHVRDFLHVEDVAEAFVSILDSNTEGTLDIGSGMGICVGDIVQLIAHKMNASHSIKLASAPDTSDNPATLVADAHRLIYEVGFTPRYTLEQGIDTTIAWWKNKEVIAPLTPCN